MLNLTCRQLLVLALTTGLGSIIVNLLYIFAFRCNSEGFQYHFTETFEHFYQRQIHLGKRQDRTADHIKLSLPINSGTSPLKGSEPETLKRNQSNSAAKVTSVFDNSSEDVVKMNGAETGDFFPIADNAFGFFTGNFPGQSDGYSSFENFFERYRGIYEELVRKKMTEESPGEDYSEDVLNNEMLNYMLSEDVEGDPHGNISYCPDKSPHLIGKESNAFINITKEELIQKYPDLKCGRQVPKECAPKEKLAVILPYRNRFSHLHTTLNTLIPFLQRQQADVTFFVIEQAPGSTFNKGALLNAGFLEVEKLGVFDCFILHDVDLIPLNDHNLYRCDSNPRHYAAAINKFGFKLYYPEHFGGVVGFSRETYLRVNGNSNLYIGWGGEDDDLRERLVEKKYKILRYPLNISRYNMIWHTHDKGNEINPLRNAILKNASTRHDIDGLNTVKYKVVNVTCDHLYTWITVSINNTEILQRAPATTLKNMQVAKKEWQNEMKRVQKKSEERHRIKTQIRKNTHKSHLAKVISENGVFPLPIGEYH